MYFSRTRESLLRVNSKWLPKLTVYMWSYLASSGPWWLLRNNHRGPWLNKYDLSVRLFIHLSVCLSICLLIHFHMALYPSVYLVICLSVHSFIHSFNHLSVCLSICLSVNLFPYVSTSTCLLVRLFCLSIHSSVCLVCLSICFSIHPLTAFFFFLS